MTKPGGVKRTAEEEVDDSEIADRRAKDDHVEPVTSSQVPDSPMHASPDQIQTLPAADKRELAVPAELSGSP